MSGKVEALPNRERLSSFLADRLRDQADELVEEWIEWIVEVVSLRPARMLPKEAIRDHIPGVIRGLADSLRDPTGTVAASVGGAIKSHARVRRDQGYDIEELLHEYRGLADIVSRRAIEALESYPADADAVDASTIFVRLATALTNIKDRTVGLYRQTEVHQKRELHRQLEDYIRTISHELKQPLHAMTAGAEMLGHEGRGASERERYLTMIKDGIARTTNLIEDVRRLALAEGAQQHQEWQLLESLVSKLTGDMRDPARRRGVRIDVQHPLPRIKVDATRIQIALSNVILNAIKYSDESKPGRWVRIAAERAGSEEYHRWRIRVTDNGLGIPAALQPQIFERHFRAHPHAADGTGLGLSISRQLIEQAGGYISFESTEGEGSSFEIVVPGYLDDTAPSAEPPSDR